MSIEQPNTAKKLLLKYLTSIQILLEVLGPFESAPSVIAITNLITLLGET